MKALKTIWFKDLGFQVLYFCVEANFITKLLTCQVLDLCISLQFCKLIIKVSKSLDHLKHLGHLPQLTSSNVYDPIATNLCSIHHK